MFAQGELSLRIRTTLMGELHGTPPHASRDGTSSIHALALCIICSAFFATVRVGSAEKYETAAPGAAHTAISSLKDVDSRMAVDTVALSDDLAALYAGLFKPVVRSEGDACVLLLLFPVGMGKHCRRWSTAAQAWRRVVRGDTFRSKSLG